MASNYEFHPEVREGIAEFFPPEFPPVAFANKTRELIGGRLAKVKVTVMGRMNPDTGETQIKKFEIKNLHVTPVFSMSIPLKDAVEMSRNVTWQEF